VSSVNRMAKTTQAISRTATLIVRSRLASMLGSVSGIKRSDQSNNHPMSDSLLVLPGTESEQRKP
jgi:hypothetical protein